MSFFFEFAGVYVYWEAICQDLDEAPFVFCSWGGGFEEFANALSTAGVSDEEVCGFCGCGRFYLGVLFRVGTFRFLHIITH